MTETFQQQFDKFFEAELLPELKRVEIIRVKQVLRQVYILVAIIIAFFGAMILFNPFLIVVILMALLVVYVIIFGRKRERFDFKTVYKRIFLDKSSGFLMPNHEFQPNRYLNADDIKQSGIIEYPTDDIEGEGLVTGMYKAAKVQLSEIHTRSRERHPDGKVTYETQYRGVLIKVELPDFYEGKTFILPHGNEQFDMFFASQYKDINILKPEPVESAYKLSPNFSAVSTSQEVSIFTNELCEALNNFKKENPQGCRVSLSENCAFIAIPYPDKMLNPGIYSSVIKNDEAWAYASYMFVTKMIINSILNSGKPMR